LGAQIPCILIADEDSGLRAELSRWLQRSGFAVECTAPGEAALTRLRAGRFDLVLTAFDPETGLGLDLLQAARGAAARLPVICMNAGGTVTDAVEALRAGAGDYLLKPFGAEALEAAVRRALGPCGPPAPAERPPDHRTGRKTFMTRDPRLLEVLEMARQVSRSTATLLILGESGTGKELLAAYVHRHGLHPEAPYVAVNCAALPESLAESELFGHEKGAFTGALVRKIGKFELAKKGTLVLDEIGEMPLPLQAKLLRVLQEREVDRVGGGMPVPVEARVIAITNSDLGTAVASGRFREDLYFRLLVVPLVIPPLRERPGDIPLLADYFLSRFSAQAAKTITGFSEEALQLLSRHEWKGNVRELENRVERAVLLSEGHTILPRHLGLSPRCDNGPGNGLALGFRPGTTVWEMERQLIMGTLSQVNQNRTRAAELLGISIRTLRNKLREYREGIAASAVARSA
jgi:DNA-binding NtrC family response regulator